MVENSFAHTGDDAFEIKSWDGYPVSNVTFQNNVCWATVGGAFMVPSEVSQLLRGVYYEIFTVEDKVYSDISAVTWIGNTVLHATDGWYGRAAIGVNSQG